MFGKHFKKIILLANKKYFSKPIKLFQIPFENKNHEAD